MGKSHLTDDFPNFVVREIDLRKNFLPTKRIDTIYFGGGTPSLLSANHVEIIMRGIANNFDIAANPEITLEANPDDLTLDLLLQYQEVGVNRISIGIQSFIDEELQFLGRRHNSQKAIDSVKLIYSAGISNVSLDLIYGLPNSSIQSWDYSLSKALELGVQHLSCYHLTYEESTPISRKLSKGIFKAIDEELSVKQFDLLRANTKKQGYLHYEISNFAKEGFISRHNSAYWHGEPYLGIGPSAHSYNIKNRQWNPLSIDEWISGINANKCNLQSETIDETMRFNELLLTGLRTIWGVDLNSVANGFEKKYIDHLRLIIDKHLNVGNLVIENNTIRIPSDKYFISDAIVEDLILIS